MHIDPGTCPCPAGSRLAWGGKPLKGHSIPEVYGAIQPTAVFVPLEALLADEASWELANTELFGPFQVREMFLFYHKLHSTVN